ncbi:hypothetical protein XENOCAPTIV_027231 [Xenoophorus captivus]|uniref:Uncharacterized protein n=1 Tax=Xenoophorus captivus TaxID=1517983 RepID=A0ABV0QKU5_9TELE
MPSEMIVCIDSYLQRRFPGRYYISSGFTHNFKCIFKRCLNCSSMISSTLICCVLVLEKHPHSMMLLSTKLINLKFWSHFTRALSSTYAESYTWFVVNFKQTSIWLSSCQSCGNVQICSEILKAWNIVL